MSSVATEARGRQPAEALTVNSGLTQLRMKRKPNLFIIGAAKCGTTSLHNYLGHHRGIYLSEPKEPCYFVPELNYYPKDLAWYLSLFADATEERYLGESTTSYTKLPVYTGVVDRIASFVNEPPRFIYLMRDPIDRAVSHYWHNIRHFEEHRPIQRAFVERVDYRAFSDYPMQLKPYFERFGRESVYTLTFEDLVQSPSSTIRQLLRWLELEPEVPGVSFERSNARPEKMQRVRGWGLLRRFALSRPWSRLSPRTPQSLKDLATHVTFRKADPQSEKTQAAVESIRNEMQMIVRALEELLGRTFPEWRTTLRQ